MSAYILMENEEGETWIDSYSIKDLPFEIGPGAFKGLGGTILGSASRLMMLRIEQEIELALHRAAPGVAINLLGKVTVSGSQGSAVTLNPGDLLKIETKIRGAWAIVNNHKEEAYLALIVMPSDDS
ncbi:MAG TPA: hypothetical protein EYQ00_10505 [Dehalococcoidia bacterium]|nr:hypothetical protein [Dehalococcoidia bacterium]